jgi:hypothetical protein
LREDAFFGLESSIFELAIALAVLLLFLIITLLLDVTGIFSSAIGIMVTGGWSIDTVVEQTRLLVSRVVQGAD